MKPSDKTRERYTDFANAVTRVREAYDRDWVATGDTFVRDALIQRFEVAFDTAWKLLKGFLGEVHGIEVVSPLTAIQEATAIGVLTDTTTWLAMKNTRNETSHIYSEEVAVRATTHMGEYVVALETLRDTLHDLI